VAVRVIAPVADPLNDSVTVAVPTKLIAPAPVVL
jgi:hypothetical protein